jgi:NAD(P)-dependent dehydrogenase (short-subunit alcohol dehydrogenase family)
MNFQMSEMKDKGVLITGSGTGIGREIALEFARQGAKVALHYSQSSEGALSAAIEAQALGVRAHAFHADLSDLAHVALLASEAKEFLGRVDILINNAGITFNKPFLKVEARDFQKIYDVNVRAGFFLAQQVVPDMVAAGAGAICNLTSIHGIQGAPEHSVYAGTKGAIIAYTRAMAVELAHKGVRVNAIAPGAVPVENYARVVDNYNEEEARRAGGALIPAGRCGYPVEIGRLAVFLCSEAASFIIGQTLVIDGGTTALMSLISDFRSESKARFGARYL